MTAETLKKKALKASADCIAEAMSQGADEGPAAALWADAALTLMKLAAEADILVRVER